MLLHQCTSDLNLSSVGYSSRTHHDWRYAYGMLRRLCRDLPDAGRRLLQIAVAAAVLQPCIGHAALGAGEASIEAERQQWQANRASHEQRAYTVHELTTPNGATIREFAGPDGVVFAVSWSGPFLPDLRTLLGVHFESLQSAARTAHPAHSKLLLDRTDLVIHSEGRLRAFAGQAYLPGLVPTGVDPTELR